MPSSKSRLSYPDCEFFFNKVLEDDVGVRTYFPIKGQAMKFRERCHQYRTICRDDNRKMYTPDHPLYGRCEYDPITLSIIPTEDASEWFVYGRKCVISETAIESLSELEGDVNAP